MRYSGRHADPNVEKRQLSTTVKSPIGQNVTQDRLPVLVMTIAHAAKALHSVASVSLDELYAGRG